MQSKEPVVDESGDLIKQLVIGSGHKVVGYSLVKDDKWQILKAVSGAVTDPGVDVIVSTGGTGFTPSDVTVQTLRPVMDREVVGFGDVFRHLSYNDPNVKAAAYLTQTTAGVVGDKVIFLLPGSPDAVNLAMRELILPEVGHLIYLVRRKES